MDLERIAANLELEHGCQVDRGAGVPLTAADKVSLVIALDHLIRTAPDELRASELRAVRAKLRKELR